MKQILISIRIQEFKLDMAYTPCYIIQDVYTNENIELYCIHFNSISWF